MHESKKSTLFLKSVLCLIAIVVLTGLVWFPNVEGRATNLNLIEIYTDPFIIYVYIASIPFFMALYEAFKLLQLIDKNQIFSEVSIKSIKKIKYYALAIIGFLIAAILCIRLFIQDDDPAGPTMLGLIAIFTSAVIATAAGVLQKLVQNAVDIKSENDLTV